MSRQPIPEEWKWFKEWARRFDDNPPDKRYGIVNPLVSNPSTEADMLYAACPLELHIMHYDNWPSVALRDHLDFIEKMEGKMDRNHHSVIR